MKMLLIVVALIVLVAALAWLIVVNMPGRSFRGTAPPLTPPQLAMRDALRADVVRLASRQRGVVLPDDYAAAAAHIEQSLTSAGYRVSRQEYDVEGVRCANIEVELRGSTKPDEIVIIGAHYDAVDEAPGADDNASGVAALLALARTFANEKPQRTLRFVAFANEEPPYFRTELMGSYVYAKRCRARNEKIIAMVSLESIGYFRDEEGSQQYPSGIAWFYPSRGNFIAFVSNLGSRSLARRACEMFRRGATVPSEGGALPESLPGVGWSDQWSFWQFDYDAIMVTDTALFRNPHYHTTHDTPDTLDYDRLTRVTDGMIAVVRGLTSAR
jgi:Zn-dependent M28 family amino/carboxypeptidase